MMARALNRFSIASKPGLALTIEEADQREVAEAEAGAIVQSMTERLNACDYWQSATGNVPLSCLSFLTPRELREIPFFAALAEHAQCSSMTADVMLERAAMLFEPQIVDDGMEIAQEGESADLFIIGYRKLTDSTDLMFVFALHEPT